MKRLAVAALLAGCIVLPEAAAQKKNELSGLIGRTFISDQTISGSTAADNLLRFGKGLTFEGIMAVE